ncbi:nuclear transport factor 2 family protein [Longimicrobium sp.]|uniref:nuclear transport factor 2 family protein n=1 Tax=Longimicrobium sp. TaxID=2029185 RepID=UPI003B3B3F0F
MMKTRFLLAAALLLCAAFAAPARAQTAADSAGIRATALDYAEGWYTGDGARMGRSLHPRLAKRISMQRDGAWTLDEMSANELARAAGGGGGTRTPQAQRQADVQILDVFGNVASVRVTMAGWIDYMHMARVDGRWQIVNVLWELKPRG